MVFLGGVAKRKWNRLLTNTSHYMFVIYACQLEVCERILLSSGEGGTSKLHVKKVITSEWFPASVKFSGAYAVDSASARTLRETTGIHNLVAPVHSVNLEM